MTPSWDKNFMTGIFIWKKEGPSEGLRRKKAQTAEAVLVIIL